MPNLTPEGCRAGRSLLQWSVRQLGAEAEISGESISAYENGRPMRETNKAKLLAVFEAHCIDILNGDAPGARMKPKGGGGTYRIDFAKAGHGFTAHPEGNALPRAFPIKATPELMRAWLAEHGYVMDGDQDRWRDKA